MQFDLVVTHFEVEMALHNHVLCGKIAMYFVLSFDFIWVMVYRLTKFVHFLPVHMPTVRRG